jgi:hypothetical protein
MEEQLPCKHQVVGSIPTCGTIIASLAQLNRALGFEPRGCGFESYEKHQITEKRAVKVGRPAWKADRGSDTMGIVLPLLRQNNG